MLLAEPEKYKDAIDVIKKDISLYAHRAKKNLKRKYHLMNENFLNE